MNNEIEIVPFDLELKAKDVTPEPIVDLQGVAEEDFADIREKLKEQGDLSHKILEDVAEFVQSSPSARVFEVFAQLLKEAGEAQERRMDLHLRRKNIGSKKGKESTTNNLIVGTTKDIIDSILNNKNVKQQ